MAARTDRTVTCATSSSAIHPSYADIYRTSLIHLHRLPPPSFSPRPIPHTRRLAPVHRMLAFPHDRRRDRIRYRDRPDIRRERFQRG